MTPIVALEEHVVWPAVVEGWRALEPRWQDLSLEASTEGDSGRLLADTGAERLAAMAATGVDMQVLSLTAPGVQNFNGTDAAVLAAESNDLIAGVVRNRPDSFSGFATLPLSEPAAAAAELGRAVSSLGLDGAMIFGHSRGHGVDDPALWGVYEAASALHAPLYLHPASPSKAVRAAYYGGFDDAVSAAFATHRLGWHFDTGVQLLRLILSGALDHFPDLQVIVGHWGEVVLFYLDRLAPLASIAHLPRPLIDYFRNQVHVTPSGMLTHRYLGWAVEVLGVDRIMFATDYPYEPASLSGARRFLETAPLDEHDRDLIAYGNWDRLRSGIRR